VEVVLTGVIGIITIRAEMAWIAAATTLSTLDRITTILHKQATDMGMNVMEGAVVEATFSVVFTVVEDTRVGVEAPTRILIHPDRRINRKALHPILILTQEAMVLKVLVTEGSHILGTTIPAPTAMVIEIIRTVHIEAILEVIHTAGMAGMVHEADMVDTVDIRTKPVTPREATIATREVEDESDEVLVLG